MKQSHRLARKPPSKAGQTAPTRQAYRAPFIIPDFPPLQRNPSKGKKERARPFGNRKNAPCGAS